MIFHHKHSGIIFMFLPCNNWILLKYNQLIGAISWLYFNKIQELIRISDLKFITVNLPMCFKKLPLWPIIGRHLAPNMPNRAALHMAWVFIKVWFYYTSHSDKYQSTYSHKYCEISFCHSELKSYWWAMSLFCENNVHF